MTKCSICGREPCRNSLGCAMGKQYNKRERERANEEGGDSMPNIKYCSECKYEILQRRHQEQNSILEEWGDREKGICTACVDLKLQNNLYKRIDELTKTQAPTVAAELRETKQNLDKQIQENKKHKETIQDLETKSKIQVEVVRKTEQSLKEEKEKLEKEIAEQNRHLALVKVTYEHQLQAQKEKHTNYIQKEKSLLAKEIKLIKEVLK